MTETQTQTIIESQRVARELYDDRDEFGLRDLHFFEQVYLMEFRAAGDRYIKICGAARRNPDLSEESVEIICRLALRTEAREMGDALRAYRKEREAFFNDTVEEVAHQMAAE